MIERSGWWKSRLRMNKLNRRTRSASPRPARCGRPASARFGARRPRSPRHASSAASSRRSRDRIRWSSPGCGAVVRVEVAGRLVGHDQRRMMDERPCDRAALQSRRRALGKWRSRGRGRRDRAALGRTSARVALTPSEGGGSATFSRRVRVGSRLKNWKTKPTVPLTRVSACVWQTPTRAAVSSCTCRRSAGRWRRTVESVDLPQPDRPINATKSPRSRVRLTSNYACTGRRRLCGCGRRGPLSADALTGRTGSRAGSGAGARRTVGRNDKTGTPNDELSTTNTRTEHDERRTSNEERKRRTTLSLFTVRDPTPLADHGGQREEHEDADGQLDPESARSRRKSSPAIGRRPARTQERQ